MNKNILICILLFSIIVFSLSFSNLRETLINISDLDSPAKSFCNVYEGNTQLLEGQCAKLTPTNCQESSCCVYVNDSICSAGNQTGPTYKTDASGNPIQVDNYIYQNQMYN